MITESLYIPNAPVLPGLVFRHFQGESDYPQMAAVIDASKVADQIERTQSVAEIAHTYAHLTNCDPYQDMLIADLNGEVVGYARAWWWQEQNGPRLYGHLGFLKPAWRRKGIGRTMLHFLQNRMRVVAASHPEGASPEGELRRFFQGFAADTEAGAEALLKNDGYTAVRYFFQMVRPALDDIPDAPVPDGLEVRPVQPEHYRAIWEADVEAFRDHWGYAPPTEEDYQA